jgi:hypothetical protein
MEPKDFSNAFNSARQEIRYAQGLSRKRQIIQHQLDALHTMNMEMIDKVVEIKEREGFPEATQLINYVRGLK